MKQIELGGAGVEVIGVNLAQPLSDEDEEVLRLALARYHLLLFRSQQLTPAQQIAVSSRFGPVLESRGVGHGYVSNVRPDGVVPDGPLLFHSDLSFTEWPYHGLSLLGLEVPSRGAATLFANAAAAVDKLPDDLRARLTGCRVLNTANFRQQFAQRQKEQDVASYEPRWEHPAIGPHPVTGTPVLFVNECASVRLTALGETESKSALNTIFAVLYNADNVYEHQWRVGDFVLWDNIAVQHGRRDFDPAERRTLQRVVLAERQAYEVTPEIATLVRRGGPSEPT
jgi:taurine dioxygenase